MSESVLHDWLNKIQWQALLEGNETVIRCFELFNAGWEQTELNPRRALTLWEEAQRLAETIPDPCLALYYRYRCCEALVLYIPDLQRGLDHAVRMLVEARKPHYQQCPILADVYRIVIDTYTFIDPVGYAEDIQEMLRHVRRNIPVDQETKYLMLDRESLLLYELGQSDKAYELALQALEEGDFTPFHAASASLWLCYLAYQRGELELAQGYARATEHYSRQSDRRMSLMIAQAWQALFALRREDTTAAQRLYHAALFYKSHLERKPSSMFYEIMLEYHQQQADWNTLQRWHQEHITQMNATGELFYECKARLRYCTFLGRRGLPYQDELQQAQTTLQRLRAPQHFSPQLTRLTRGEFDD